MSFALALFLTGIALILLDGVQQLARIARALERRQ